jgi:trans-aconitate methyltransferase
LTTQLDQWVAASKYEAFMGRWSRPLAHEYVSWLEPGAKRHWLELGCGTGALTQAICADADPAAIIACDPAQQFVAYARQHFPDPRVTFIAAGADDFPFRAGGYDLIVSLLALNFFPNPLGSLQRTRRGVAPGGSCSACVWDYADGMEFLRYFWAAARAIDARAAAADEGARFPVCRPDILTQLFSSAGFSDVRCDALEITTEFRSFDDYWTPFLGATGPAPTFVSTLEPSNRAALRTRLESMLPSDAHGRIRLRARAWAVRGQVTSGH